MIKRRNIGKEEESWGKGGLMEKMRIYGKKKE